MASPAVVDGGATSTNDTTTSSSSAPTIRANSRKNRVYVFRDFLVNTYTASNSATTTTTDETTSKLSCYLLKPGDVILDVAGGKGDLSWLLANVDGIQSVVVDPRRLSSTSHLIRSVVWLQQHPDEAQERAIPHRPTHQPLAALIPQITEAARLRTKMLTNNEDDNEAHSQEQEPGRQSQENVQTYLEPQNFQIKLDKDFVEAVRESKQQGSYGNDECPEPWKGFWDTYKSCHDERQISENERATDEWFLPESERTKTSTIRPAIKDASRAWHILQSVRLIVGFHPDGATEACVDLAEVLRVPVCIVPCCVFPSEFPDRKLVVDTANNNEDGGTTTTTTTRVRDYQQLLQYLQQKHPKLRKHTLNFHQTETSRNVVLYTLPEDLE